MFTWDYLHFKYVGLLCVWSVLPYLKTEIYLLYHNNHRILLTHLNACTSYFGQCYNFHDTSSTSWILWERYRQPPPPPQEISIFGSRKGKSTIIQYFWHIAFNAHRTWCDFNFDGITVFGIGSKYYVYVFRQNVHGKCACRFNSEPQLLVRRNKIA